MTVATSSARDAAQRAVYSQVFKDINAHVEADDAFSKVKVAVESRLGLLQKQAQVRVRNWLKKLSEETANVVWKKNRNAYARLLLEQLRCGTLAEPFGAQPPDGPLPTLPKHLAYAFKPARASSPTAAPSPTARQQPQLSATAQLDEYLGRSQFRRSQFPGEQAAVVAGAAPQPAGSADAEGVTARYLPGTRMQLRGTEAGRVDTHQLGDIGWQPSKLELEAQLGASRERQAELEWRLQQMEGLVRQHAVLLHPGQPAGLAPPLGALLDALEGGGTVVPSPRRQREGNSELEDLVERFETQRRQRRSARKPRQAQQPAIASGDEAEMLEQLGTFQQHTEAIRHALGDHRGSSPRHRPTPPSARSAGGSSGAAAEWVAVAGTPLRQHPTGLVGSGFTPHWGGAAHEKQRGLDLFDGLPPTPAALLPAPGHGHQHEHRVSASDRSSSRQILAQGEQQQQQQEGAQQPAAPQAASKGGRQQQQQQRVRSPIGPEVRHTKKSAAAAAEQAEQASAAAGAALQRLKSSRQPNVASSPASQLAAAAQSPGAPGCHLPQPALPAEEDGAMRQPGMASAGIQAGGDRAGATPHVSAQPPAPPPPQPPPLPADGNAALVAEVRQLRFRLLSSLQKHDPTGAAAAAAAPASAAAGLMKLRGWWEPGASQADAWRLAAVPPAASSPAFSLLGSGATTVLLGADPSSPRGSPWQAAGGVALDGSRKYRLTDCGSSSGGWGPAASPAPSAAAPGRLGEWGDTTPPGLSTGSGSVAGLSSLGLGGSRPASRSDAFVLDAFEEQTASPQGGSLQRRLAGL